jgi:hypothetical protein
MSDTCPIFVYNTSGDVLSVGYIEAETSPADDDFTVRTDLPLSLEIDGETDGTLILVVETPHGCYTARHDNLWMRGGDTLDLSIHPAEGAEVSSFVACDHAALFTETDAR